MSQERHDRLSDLLIEALDLDADARQSFLERLRREEPDLAGEVEALLDVEEELETSFLAKPILEDNAAVLDLPAEQRSGATTTFLTLDERSFQVGPYKLLRLLGAGGMGKVFLAHQEEPFNRKVALKLIRSGFRNLTSRARFEAEQKLLAKLDHPNIGRILDAGTTDDGFPFFALELVPGEPLTEYCDNRNLTLEDRLEIMIAVCRGVEHAHRKQIIHRDLKPSNILVAEVDGKPVPKIIDFGIAKSLDLESQESADVPDRVVGTPAYMSPEAMDGSDDIDTRADVYALGILLYLLIAGRRPFDGELLQDLQFRVPKEDPPAPSLRIATGQIDADTATSIAQQRGTSWSELRRRVKGDLDWILLKATARAKEDRYGSADALADDLESFLHGRPIQARPGHWSYRVSKWMKRNRAVVAANVLLASLVVGLVIQGVRSERRTERLTRASEELTREVERTEWRMRVANLMPRQELTSELQSIRQSMTRLKARIPELYAGAEGPAEYALGRGSLSLGDLAEAREHLERAWQLGYQRQEVALALGTTLGLLYEQGLDVADRGPDAESRRKLRKKVESELRDPALAMLGQAESDLTFSDLVSARVAFYRDDLDGALLSSRTAFEHRPSLFEAKFLEARVLQRLAEREDDKDQADLLLQQAGAAASEGLKVARSSFEGYLRLCQTSSALAGHRVRYSRDGIEDAFEQGSEACAVAESLIPGSPEVGLTQAGLHHFLAEHQLWSLGIDPGETLGEARKLLREVRRDAGEDPAVEAEVERMLGGTFVAASAYNERSGQDPRASYSAAIGHLQKANELQPGFYTVNSNLAQVYSRRANYDLILGNDPSADIDQSIQYARAAVADEPDLLLAHVYLAQTLIFKAEHDSANGRDPMPSIQEAMAATERAESIERSRIAVLGTATAIHMVQGVWELKIGKDPTAALDRCIESSVETVQSFPDASFPMLMRGQCLMYLATYDALFGRSIEERTRASRASYAEGLEKLPSMAGPQTELAQLALVEAGLELQLGQSPLKGANLALKHAERALELDEERIDAVRLKAEAQMRIAQWKSRSGGFDSAGFQRAEATMARAIDAKPNLAEHRLALAEILWAKASSGSRSSAEDVQRGLSAAERSLEIDGSQLRAMAVRGALLTLSPDTEAEGQRTLSEAIDRNPSLAWTWRDVVNP